LKLFGPNEIVAAIGRVLVFVGGSLGAVLFAFAALNDAILLHVKIGDWNLLWYAGLVGALYSGGNAMLPNFGTENRSSRNMLQEIDDALAKVSSHTHYYPREWKGRGWDENTHRAFSSMFQFKAKLFLVEVLSLIAAPYVLCVSLTKCAEPICEFILAIRADVAGVGDICGYSTFDFEKYSDETWEGLSYENQDPLTGTLTESILRTGNVDEAAKNFPLPRARNGKMKESYESFRVSRPQRRDLAGLRRVYSYLAFFLVRLRIRAGIHNRQGEVKWQIRNTTATSRRPP
jgi:autophagy-related protein 9